MTRWAIYTDLSGVAPVSDGKFETELEARQHLVTHLESNLSDAKALLATAKAGLRMCRKAADA